MDEQVAGTVRRRAVVAGLVGVVVVLVVVVVIALLRSGAGDDAGGGGATGSPPVDATGSSPSPSDTASPDAAVAAQGDGGAAGEGADVVPGAVPVPPMSDVAPVVVETTGEARTVDGLSVTVTSVAATDVAGTGPGEYAGPGIVVGVRVTNEGAVAVPLVSPAVSVYAGAGGMPVNPVLTDPATVALPAEVAPGATVEGSYRFAEASPSGAALAVAVLLSPATEPVVAQGFRLG